MCGGQWNGNWNLDRIPCFQESTLECFGRKEVVKTTSSSASQGRKDLMFSANRIQFEVKFLSKFKEVRLTASQNSKQ